MNISQGMVRCARCQHVFDAYSCFVFDPEYRKPPLSNFFTDVITPATTVDTEHFSPSQDNTNIDNIQQVQYVNQLMSESIEGSRLNLYTYLNHLDTLNPIHSQKQQDENNPSSPISTTQSTLSHQHSRSQKKKNILYYSIWGIINLLLVILFIYQIFFFNYPF